MIEIYCMETLRDVFEYAFVDCPAKQKYLDALLPLNPNGSTAYRVPIPERYKKDMEPSAEAPMAEEQPAAVVTETETVAEATE
jgi:Lon-like ATP-dependent protease